MIDSILDFGIDHSAVFAAVLVAMVVSVTVTAVWAYGRYHDRASRRRGVPSIG